MRDWGGQWSHVAAGCNGCVHAAGVNFFCWKISAPQSLATLRAKQSSLKTLCCTCLQLGRTPLHLACEKGHISTAGALVAGGADLLAKDRVSGQLLLLHAAVASRPLARVAASCGIRRVVSCLGPQIACRLPMLVLLSRTYGMMRKLVHVQNNLPQCWAMLGTPRPPFLSLWHHLPLCHM